MSVSIPFKREGTGELALIAIFVAILVSIPFKREGTGELIVIDLKFQVDDWSFNSLQTGRHG